MSSNTEKSPYPVQRPLAASALPGLSLKWSANVCHFHTGFIEPLAAALAGTGTYATVVNSLRNSHPQSFAAALRKVLVARFDSTVTERALPLSEAVQLAHRLGLSPAVPIHWQPEGWLNLMRSEAFGGSNLLDLVTIIVQESGSCSHAHCPRNVRPCLHWRQPYLFAQIRGRYEDVTWPVDLSSLVQAGYDSLCNPVYRRTARDQCVCRATWLHNDNIVECTGLYAPAGDNILTLPQVLWVRTYGQANVPGAKFSWDRQRVHIKTAEGVINYRAVAVVLSQMDCHFVALVRFQTRWFKCEYYTLEEFDMPDDIFSTADVVAAGIRGPLRPVFFVFQRA